MAIIDDAKETLVDKPEIKEEKPKEKEPEEKSKEKEPEEEVEIEIEKEEDGQPSETDNLKKKVSDLNKALASERAAKKGMKVDKTSEYKGEKPKGEDVDIESLIAEKVEEATSKLRSEHTQDTERKARQEVFEKIPDFYEHYDDIISYYEPHFGKETTENEVENLMLAASIYEKKSGKKVIPDSFVRGKEEGKKEALVEIAQSGMANLPSGSSTGISQDPALTSDQKRVVNRGNMTSKEYKKFSGGESFELPIHEEAINH